MDVGDLIRVLLIQPVSEPLPGPLHDEEPLPTRAELLAAPVPLER
jgi:hypothetical protein